MQVSSFAEPTEARTCCSTAYALRDTKLRSLNELKTVLRVRGSSLNNRRAICFVDVHRSIIGCCNL